MTSRVTAFKSLAPNEYKITPFRTYASHDYTYVSGSTNNSVDVKFSFGSKYLSKNEIRVENDQQELFSSVMQTFYSPLAYASYGTKTNAYVPRDKVYVIGVTQDIFGEQIVPGTFNVTVNTSQSYDDGRGNLIASSSVGAGSIIGRIFYDKGIALIKPEIYTNYNPDPLWEDMEGGISSADGWQFLIDRKLTSELKGGDGVFHPFPGTETYAAAIATRTSYYMQAYNFYYIPVTPGETIKISGWVYAGGNTYRGILNGKALGSDYPIGFIVTFTDSSTSFISDAAVKTELGSIGWKYLSEEFVVPAGCAYINVGTFIDGPYPNGYSLSPECSEEDKLLGCPGYAWFAGLRIEKIDPAVYEFSANSLDNRGMFVGNGNSIRVQFSSSLMLNEHNIRIKLDPIDFMQSPYNPTSEKIVSASSRAIDLMASQSLYPYVTTIGLYNPNNELLAVAKLSNPIQRTDYTTQTFVIKFDTEESYGT